MVELVFIVFVMTIGLTLSLLKKIFLKITQKAQETLEQDTNTAQVKLTSREELAKSKQEWIKEWERIGIKTHTGRIIGTIIQLCLIGIIIYFLIRIFT
ncbi:hypothetical protein BKH43_06935 [Helicobacter sp. 13S00401-1]|uniref:hypothetical protein n=1 Tax=Helicobacter sp. 13S00401-1 TaxID=1905758 RepID=UPI000BA5B22B|nr:hypothetical protein [Helicobacter sp. 13S00401-1]PAF49310.1 hypothetical protein BKH43_06935 [Helicobacter sp. 13S00401-1]